MKFKILLTVCILSLLTAKIYAQTTVRVFLLGGQSNIIGWNGGGLVTELPAVLQKPQNVQIKVFGSTNITWGQVRPGLGMDATHFGPEITFAWDIAKKYPGQNIAIIKGAWPATSLNDDWKPPTPGNAATAGSLYEKYVTQVNTAINELKTKYTNVIVEGMCWMQGESDAERTTVQADAYETNLNWLITDLRKDLKVPNMPFVIGMIDIQPIWKYSAKIRAAEIKAAETLPNVYTFDTQGYATDGIHYTTQGRLRLGADFAMVLNNRISPNLNSNVGCFYADCQYTGKETGLAAGDYTFAKLTAAGIADKSVSSIKMMDAFKTVAYTKDNYTGNSREILQDNACLTSEKINDSTTSLKIKSNGQKELTGTYYLKNIYSGQYMSLNNGDTSNLTTLVQKAYTGAIDQKFILTEVEEGIYRIAPAKAKKQTLDIGGWSKSNGTNVIEWPWANTDNQKFVVSDEGTGTYNLFSKYSGIALEVSWENNTSAATITQRGDGSDASGKWKLEALVAASTGIVTTYSDCNKGGFSSGLALGDYTSGELVAMGIGNNGVSSVYVTAGYKVTLYKSDNFKGDSIILTADNACLINSQFNDSTSSIRVRKVILTGLDDKIQPSSLSIYPNPADDHLFISSSKDLSGAVINIFDIQGKLLSQSVIKENTVNISSLQQGFYLIQITDTESKSVHRFIKQ